MQLYFINLMTKFTFIFLSLLPLLSLKPFPSGKRAKQHKQRHIQQNERREITLQVTKRPLGATWGVWVGGGGRGGRPPLWLLSSAFSYLFDVGQEGKFPVSPLLGSRMLFVPPSSHFCGTLSLESPTALCPYISFPIQK